MNRILSAVSIAAVVALATPALAASQHGRTYVTDENPAVPAEAVGGAAVGTAVGVGAVNGWWGGTVAGVAVPTTAVGSAAIGGVAGIGTVVLIDAAVQPCRGFHAVFMLNRDQCVNGEYVGYKPQRVSYLRERRVIER
jgi:hypothetical protein